MSARSSGWPQIVAVVLALVAIGTTGAAISRGCGGAGGGVDADMLVRVLPDNTGTVRGLSWESLRRTALGRRFADGLREDFLSDMTVRSCGVEFEDVIRWLVRMTEPDRLASGVTVAGLGWPEKRVNDCVRKLAHDQGAELDIHREGRLRSYVLGGKSQWAAWLSDSTAMIAGAWSDDDQHAILQSIVDRDRPAKASPALTRALRRVDTAASFWLVLRRPVRAPADPDDYDVDLGSRSDLERWYDDRVSDLLGVRPDAIYLSLDVGSHLTIRGGAVLHSETQAGRAADHLRAVLSDYRGHSVGALDLNRLDPRLRDDLARRFREGQRRAGGVETLLAERGRVSVSGRVVIFRAAIAGDALDVLVRDASSSELLDDFNHLLPSDLSLRL